MLYYTTGFASQAGSDNCLISREIRNDRYTYSQDESEFFILRSQTLESKRNC